MILSLGDKIRDEFDNSFVTVKKRGIEVPFSSDIILSALVETGISPLDAIDILYQIKLYLQPGISTKKIIKLLNKTILNFGYDENALVKAETTIPIMIDYKDKMVELSFKVIKEIVREYMAEMRYTSKTFRDLIDELHRTLIGLETWQLTIADVNKLIPTVLRNVVGTNPFAQDRCVEDYQLVVKLKISIEKTWIALPTEERQFILISYFNAAFRVILLSFNFLPGHILNSTIYQINNMITHLTGKNNRTLTNKEMTVLLELTERMNKLINDKQDEEDLEYPHWEELIYIIANLCDGLMNSNPIRWIVGREREGRDIFSFSSIKHQEDQGVNTILISSALFGIETQLSEITKSQVKQLDQGENAILIDKRYLFTLISQVEKPISHLVNQKLTELANFIEKTFTHSLEHFKGNITEFQLRIGEYLRNNFENIFVFE